MSEVSESALQLKALREKAGISSRKLAQEIGWPHTKYIHYEMKYKRKYLPIELITAVTPVLLGKGIPEAAVKSLAGGSYGFEELNMGEFHYGHLPTSINRRNNRELLFDAALVAKDFFLSKGFNFNEKEVKELARQMVEIAEFIDTELVNIELAEYLYTVKALDPKKSGA